MAVLVIISVVTVMITFRPTIDMTKGFESRIFFEEMLSQLKLGQQQAVTQNINVAVNFSVGTQSYFIQDLSNNRLLYQKSLPEHLELKDSRRFVYSSQGSISQFDTIRFEVVQSGEIIKLVFQLGNGQFELQ